MKLFPYLYNLGYNIFQLLKILCKNRIVRWNILTSNATNCNIDKGARLYPRYSLSNVTIGKGTYVGFNANISDTFIGKFCSIGPNFFCGWGIHPTNGISTSPMFYSTKKQAGSTYSSTDKIEERKLIHIGNDVFIGANVTVLDGVTIGDGAIIGAGAVVSKNIPPYAIAIGCPIQIIKYRFPPEIINSLAESKWWDQDEEVLRDIEKNFFDIEKFLLHIKSKE